MIICHPQMQRICAVCLLPFAFNSGQGRQIALEHCKEELAEAQKEMALQRQLSTTEVAQQMTGELNVPRTRMIVEQAQQGHATELKRRWELDAAQQQQIIEPATNLSLHNSDAGIMFHATIATAGSTAAKARGKIMNVPPTQYSWRGHSIDADMSESDCRPPSISLHFLKDSSAPKMTNGMMNSRLASQFPHPGAVVVDRHYN